MRWRAAPTSIRRRSASEDPRDVLLMLAAAAASQRLIVFMDEIDVLLNVDFREQIFSKFRSVF